MANFVSNFYGGKSAGGIGSFTPAGKVYQMFGGGKDEIQPRPDYPYMSAENLYNWAGDYQKKYDYDPAAPYPGKLTAPRTETEKYGQKRLGEYVRQPISPTLGAAEKYSTGVLQGDYDPRTSPYYKAMKEQIYTDYKEGAAAGAHESARSGQLHSDPGKEIQEKYKRKMFGDLSSLLGAMYETERGRMGEAAKGAPALATARETLPMKKIAAATTTGALPRLFEQQGLERTLGEYLRQQAGAKEPLNIYAGLSGKDYQPYAAQPYSPGQGAGADLMGTMTQLLPILLPMLMGSSATYKNNITDNEIDSIKVIKQCKIKNFNYNDNIPTPKKRYVGVIAEEAPDILTTKDKKEFDMYSAIGILIDANKKLIGRVEELESIIKGG